MRCARSGSMGRKWATLTLISFPVEASLMFAVVREGLYRTKMYGPHARGLSFESRRASRNTWSPSAKQKRTSTFAMPFFYRYPLIMLASYWPSRLRTSSKISAHIPTCSSTCAGPYSSSSSSDSPLKQPRMGSCGNCLNTRTYGA